MISIKKNSETLSFWVGGGFLVHILAIVTCYQLSLSPQKSFMETI